MGKLELSKGAFEVPVSVFCGKRPGQTVLITAGVQAGEYVGIQSAIDLARHLQIEKVNGTIIIVKVIRKEEFEHRAGSLGVKDGKNLNREFPGKADGTETERLAYAVATELFPYVDRYIDLHSGNDYERLTPFVYYAGCAKKRLWQCRERWQNRSMCLIWYVLRSQQVVLIIMLQVWEFQVF